MSARRLIVCEQSGRWAAAARNELQHEPVRVLETRSLAECEQRLREGAAAVVAIELTATNVDAVFEWLLRFAEMFPAACAVVLAQRGLEEYELLARELGAIYFTTSPRELGPLVGIVRSGSGLGHPHELSPTQQIMAELPWGE